VLAEALNHAQSNPARCCHLGTAIKHPVSDWVKLSFVIFDIRTLVLSAEHQSVRMSKITNGWLNPVWHWMLYSCTHMTTVGIKGLTCYFQMCLIS